MVFFILSASEERVSALKVGRRWEALSDSTWATPMEKSDKMIGQSPRMMDLRKITLELLQTECFLCLARCFRGE